MKTKQQQNENKQMAVIMQLAQLSSSLHVASDVELFHGENETSAQ